jgi:predicted CoA-binding protein
MSILRGSRTVVILGASNKSYRYSNLAIKLLLEKGYRVIPIHPKLKEIEGLPVTHSLAGVQEKVDTLTMYVGPERSRALADSIVSLKPKRVIFNPGTESSSLEGRLTQNNIPFIKACTIVMLQTGEF